MVGLGKRFRSGAKLADWIGGVSTGFRRTDRHNFIKREMHIISEIDSDSILRPSQASNPLYCRMTFACSFHFVGIDSDTTAMPQIWVKLAQLPRITPSSTSFIMENQIRGKFLGN